MSTANERLTVDELRAAAARLVDPAANALEDLCPPVPKRALALLVEEPAFAGQTRPLSLTEVRELGDWIRRCADLDGDEDRCDLLLASVGAWQADYASDADDGRKDLVVAIATYLLRRFARTAADALQDAQGRETP